uniref:Endonuclease/exonuclease/phosphatase domain-containing protein n=1 Tax=Micrurus carvalhoi TaxID=3147026 RepID=A0A2H6MU70_9SAUR
MSWNVAGWYRFRGLNYPDALLDKDIILVQETWTMDDFLLKGYKSYKLEARPGRGPGRLKGGLGIFISTNLRAEPTLIAPLKHMAMALLLKMDSYPLEMKFPGFRHRWPDSVQQQWGLAANMCPLYHSDGK